MSVHKPLAAAAAILAASPALAGSLDPVIAPVSPVVAPAPVIAPAPVAPASDWTGFYIGGQLGFGNLTVDGEPSLDDDYDGALYGIHAGYQRDFGRFVLGAEVDWDMTEISVGPPGAASAIDVDSVARAKLRFGYDAGRVLPYVTGGYARAMLSSDDAATDALLDDSYDGFFFGAGADFAVTDRFAVGAEVLRHDFGDTPLDGIDVDVTTISLRASFRF